MPSKTCLLVTLLCVVAILSAGCGANAGRASVEGSVTAGGQPVEQGSITFIPLDPGKSGSAGREIVAGKYSLTAAQGPLPGKYRVEIKATRKTGEKIVDDMKPAPNNLVDKIEQFIPARYNTTSELTVDLEAGANHKNFDLKLEP